MLRYGSNVEVHPQQALVLLLAIIALNWSPLLHFHGQNGNLREYLLPDNRSMEDAMRYQTW